jgi:PTS system cellobiose-specific IIB component
MNNILVICKGTGQSKSFEKVMNEYTKKENLPINWVYASDREYIDVIASNDIKMVIISPEVMLNEAKIKLELTAKEIKYIAIKPAAFGLKQTEKFMPDVLSILGI